MKYRVQPKSYQRYQWQRFSPRSAYKKTRNNFGMKPIFTEIKLNNSSLRLRITRKNSQRKKLWILQIKGFSAHLFESISLLEWIQAQPYSGLQKINYGLQDDYFMDSVNPKLGEKTEGNWRCNQFLKTGKTDIIWKVFNQSILVRSRPISGSHEIILNIHETFQTPLAASALIGSCKSIKKLSNPPRAIYGKTGQTFGLILSYHLTPTRRYYDQTKTSRRQIQTIRISYHHLRVDQQPYDHEYLHLAALDLFVVSCIKTPTSLFPFFCGRDQYLSSSKKRFQKAQITFKTIHVQYYSNSPLQAKIPIEKAHISLKTVQVATISPTANFWFCFFVWFVSFLFFLER